MKPLGVWCDSEEFLAGVQLYVQRGVKKDVIHLNQFGKCVEQVVEIQQ